MFDALETSTVFDTFTSGLIRISLRRMPLLLGDINLRESVHGNFAPIRSELPIKSDVDTMLMRRFRNLWKILERGGGVWNFLIFIR